MKAALVTPCLNHLPLHPGLYLGYGAAVLKRRFELETLDLNAELYFQNREALIAIFDLIDREEIIFDGFNLYLFYLSISKNLEETYRQVPWGSYRSVFITTPSWFVTIPTEAVLMLSDVVQKASPRTNLFFFGNSVGTWTDETVLAKKGIGILSLSNLFDATCGCRPVDYDSLPVPAFECRDKYLYDILPFRLKHGCRWGKCSFCSLAKGWNSGYMERSPVNVLRELEEVIRKYDPRMLICRDNAVNGGNLREFCSGFEGYHVPWAGMARADLSPNDIAALRKSGCVSLYFGLESGSDKVLAGMNKGLNSRQISDFIRILRDHGIMPAPSVIVGSPDETDDDFEKTVEFVLDHSTCFKVINLHPFTVTPQSGLSRTGATQNANTLQRLLRLAGTCRDAGLKVCVGEQSAEYVLCREALSGTKPYASSRNAAAVLPVS